MAREQERRHRTQPTRWASVQSAAAAERRLRDRLPYRDKRIEVTAFNIGGMDVPEVRAMAELYPVSQIFDNHVYPGVLHRFIDVGIPAFTPEIGAARVLHPDDLAVRGRHNERTEASRHPCRANGSYGRDLLCLSVTAPTPILATEGGLVEHLVKLNDKVEAGQKVAIQRNSFGEVVAEYTSGVAGESQPAQRCNVRAGQHARGCALQPRST